MYVIGTKWLAAVVLIAFLPGCNSPVPSSSMRQLDGQPFPDVMLKGLDGNEVSITRHQGKLVVLNFWATWCPPCRKELPSLQRLSQALDPSHYAVIGVTVDLDQHLVNEFLLDKAVTYPNYMDPEMRLTSDALGVRLFPATFIIAPDGTLLGSIFGEMEWDSDEVKHALQEALQGRRERLLSLRAPQ